MLRYTWNTESQKGILLVFIEGLIAGVKIETQKIERFLSKTHAPSASVDKKNRQRCQVLCGVRSFETIGSPLVIEISGLNKSLNYTDLGRRVVGLVAQQVLSQFGILIGSQKLSQAGVYELKAKQVPPGLGGFSNYDTRLSAKICSALIEINEVECVEVGLGFGVARRPGSEVHDEIFYRKTNGFIRKTNRAGGLEGGMTNGEDLVLRFKVKKKSPLKLFGLIGEAVLATELLRAFFEKFGGDSLKETKRNFFGYLKQLKDY